MNRKIIVIPAKSKSSRVPEKNWRLFARGMSLVEWKISTALATSADLIVISTDRACDSLTHASHRLMVRSRPKSLCGDHVSIRELFNEVLTPFSDDVIFWAHPTSPFINAALIDTSFQMIMDSPGTCLLGVKKMNEFLWTQSGPLNYDPSDQPRSQDMESVYAVTGGIHCAFGRDFIRNGAIAFQPAKMIPVDFPALLDIDTMDDWNLAQIVAESPIANHCLPQ